MLIITWFDHMHGYAEDRAQSSRHRKLVTGHHSYINIIVVVFYIQISFQRKSLHLEGLTLD